MLVEAFFWAVVSFFLRALFTIVIHAYSVSVGFEGFYPLASGADDRFYYETAKQLAEGGSVEDLPNVYPGVLAGFYALFGPSLLLGQLLSSLIASIGVYFGVRLAALLEGGSSRHPFVLSRPSNLTGLLLTFYPSGLFYSTQLLKDPWIFALTMMVLYWGVVLYLKGFEAKRFTFLLIVLPILYLFRHYAAIAFLMAFAIFIMLQTFYRPSRLLLVLLLAVALPLGLGWGPFGMGRLLPLLDPEALSRFREEAYSIGGSAADITLDFSSPWAFLLTYGYSYLTVALGPFPWQVKSPVMAIGLMESALMWLLLLGVFLRRKRLPRLAFFPLLFALVYLGGVALFSDNIGANTRLRLVPWSCLLIWVALRLGYGRLGYGKHEAHPLPHHPR